MGFDIFIKNEFLNQSIGQFTDKMGMMSKVDICNVIVQNKSWYVSKSVMRKALANNEDKVSSIFKKIDGRVLNSDAILDGRETTEVRRADDLLEKQEIFQLVKDYYRQEKNVRLSDEEVSKMKMSEFIEIISKMYDSLEKQDNDKK